MLHEIDLNHKAYAESHRNVNSSDRPDIGESLPIGKVELPSYAYSTISLDFCNSRGINKK